MSLTELPVASCAVVIRPGDHVLICLHAQDITAQESHELQESLQKRLPGVDFTLVNGVSALAVRHP